MKDITTLDKNLKQISTDSGLSLLALDETAAVTYGLYGEDFNRIPKIYADNMPENVQSLQRCTSGGRIAFSTSAKQIAIRVLLKDICRMPHMTFLGSAGIDVLVNGLHLGSFWSEDGEDFIRAERELPDGEKDILIYLPLYSGVSQVWLGVPDGESINAPNSVPPDKPIVFYGSSITQGASASRPISNYCSLLAQKLGYDFYNLGFSGNALGEQVMAEYIAGLPMSCFVYDYDHNAPEPAHLEKTHLPFLQTILKAQPNIPVIMLSRPDITLDPSAEQRRAIIEKTFETVHTYKKNIWYVNGRTMLSDDMRQNCSVDTCHPNDIGFYQMYQAVLPLLKESLSL